MELKNIALHYIKRERNETPELKLSDHLLSNNETTGDFIAQVVKSYTSKSPTYGAFDKDITNNPFQSHVKNYFDSNDFLIFSTQAMNTLKSEIDIPQAKGGYVVFAHYVEKTKDFIITIMLDNAVRFVVNDNLDIEKLLGLDVDKVARANRINWQEWQNNEDTYLSFIKGTRGISDYFAKKFIGCTDFTSSKQNAKNLELAVSSYMRDKNFTDDKKIDVKRNIKEYIDNQIDKRLDIQIDAISARIDADNPTMFTEYSHQNKWKVGNFKSTRKSDFKSFEIKTLIGDGYKLEYNLSSDNVQLDKDGNMIVIKNIPDSVFED